MGPAESHKSLKAESFSRLWLKEDVTTAEEWETCPITGFEGGKRDHEPRNVGAQENGKKRQGNSLLWSPKKEYSFLDSSPVKLLSDFRFLEL